jgi:hypothetical protein
MRMREQADLKEQVESWLRAERAENAGSAEAALYNALRSIGSPEPPAGFTDKLMLRALREGVLANEQRASSRRTLRWAAVACLLLSGLAFTVAPSVLYPVIYELMGPMTVVEWITSTVVGTVHRIAVGMETWNAMYEIGATLSRSLVSQSVAIFAVGAALASIGAFGVLQRILMAEEGLNYARKSS